jgi:hypothetical protein
MKNNSTISFSALIVGSIFFKIFFFSFLSVSSNPLYSNYPSFQQETFKFGKKRRRTVCYSSQSRTEETSQNGEQIFAEKTELENNNNLFKRLKLPLLSFFSDCLSFINAQIKPGVSGFLYPLGNLSSRKRLSVSILRI